MIIEIVVAAAAVGALIKWLTPDYARLEKTHRMDAAPSGLRDGDAVTLTGVVIAGDTLLEAPLTGTTCVFWAADARVKEHQKRKVIVTDEFHASGFAPFKLETRYGVISVEGTEADTELPLRGVVPRRLELDRAFLEAHGRDPYFARTSGLDEVAIAPGERISVYGQLVVERAEIEGEAGYRDERVTYRLIDHPSHRLTLGKPR